MEQAHHEGPLSYTFLGPSGVFVKEFSEWFSRRLNSSIPRSNFLVIDQFAGNVYSHAYPGRIYVDKHLLKVFIANIIGSASQKDLGCFYPLKDSLGLVGFATEAIIEARDDGEAKLMDKLASDEARSLIRFVQKEIEARYETNLFDTFEAYRKVNVEGIKEHVRSRFGKSLFLDGFTNLSTAQMIFLSRITPLFDETFMTLDPAFIDLENWTEFKEMLKAHSIEIFEEQLVSCSEKVTAPLERLLRNQGPPVSLEGNFIRIACLKDPETELIQVCRDIKRRIVDDGMKPEEIAVVLNNFSERAQEFSRKLEEYGVPVKVSGEEPLSSSIAIQLLTLPFRASLAGYPPHTLISMLDHGLGLSAPSEFDLDGLEALAKGSGLYMGPRRSSLKDRRDEWKTKLEGHLEALRQRREVLALDDTAYDGDLQAKEAEILLCQEILDKSEELFQALEGIEAAREGKADLKLFMKEMSSWIAPLKARFLNKRDLETEAMAIAKFERILDKLDGIISTIGSQSLTLSDFMAFLEILLSSEEYRPSPPLVNKVEVLSLHSARFRHRSLKYIVDFNDGIFPSRRSNPLYFLESMHFGDFGYCRTKEREQREALYSCLCSSGQAVITYPKASREGEPMEPSLWLDGWNWENARPLDLLISPMSPEELKIEFGLSLAKGEDVAVPNGVQSLLDPLKLYAGSEFSWKIGDKAIMNSLVGKRISYTKLSEFNGCPFKFFLHRILGLEENAGDLYELSPLEMGTTYHTALKSLYDLKSEGMTWDRAISEGMVRGIVEDIIQRFLAANRIRSLPAVRDSMAGNATSWLEGYLQFEMNDPRKAFIGEKTITELPFSLRLGDMASLISSAAEKYGDMIFQGRIDRIDLNVSEKKQIYDMVLSDYKSSSAGEWDQLKLYTLALMSLYHKDLPKEPKLIKSFFRLVKKGTIANKLDAFPDAGRMDLQTRPKSSLTFSEVDRDLLQTLDRIFEEREFLPGQVIDDGAAKCYFCGFKSNCQGLLDLRWRQ